MSDPLNDLLKAAKSALDWFDAGLVGSALDEPAEQVDFPAQDLRAAIAAAEAAPTGWQPIETAPKDGRWIWVAGTDDGLGASGEDSGYWNMRTKTWILKEYGLYKDLSAWTHWHPYTPLPPLPKGES
jgi:hypothetical protein